MINEYEVDLTDSGYLAAMMYDEVPCIDDILATSKFTVYHVDVLDNLTKSRIDNYHAICALLTRYGVKDSDIVRANVDSFSDMDLIEYISQRSGGNFKPPVVFMGNEFLGGYHDLCQLHTNGKLKQIIETRQIPQTTTPFQGNLIILPEPENLSVPAEIPTVASPESSPTTNAQPPQLRTVDTVLEVVETVVDYLNPLSYLRSFSTWSTTARRDENASTCTEFDIIHTNWYGRNQRRKLRFCDKDFLRVHPNGLVRATIKYVDISKIHKLDPTRIVIYYSTSSCSPDWIGGTEQDVSSIITLLLKKIPTLKVLSVLTNEHY